MNPAKMLIVALTRFYGIVLLFYGIFYSTYLGPFYHRLIIIYENPATHAEAARIFGVRVAGVVLRMLVGLIIFARAESIIDSLRRPEPALSLRSLIVALVKLNGFILLFYGALSAIDLTPTLGNLPHFGWSAIRSIAPGILRVGLDLLAGFLVVACAEKIIEGLERHEPGKASGDPATATEFYSGHVGGET
jgi:hypothetical protein